MWPSLFALDIKDSLTRKLYSMRPPLAIQEFEGVYDGWLVMGAVVINAFTW